MYNVRLTATLHVERKQDASYTQWSQSLVFARLRYHSLNSSQSCVQMMIKNCRSASSKSSDLTENIANCVILRIRGSPQQIHPICLRKIKTSNSLHKLVLLSVASLTLLIFLVFIACQKVGKAILFMHSE